MTVDTPWQNWSGLVEFSPAHVVAPTTVAELQAAVTTAQRQGRRVKMAGSGHSFTPIAATDGVLIDPSGLTGITQVDYEAMTVTALAGTQLKTLNRTLELLGLSLHNMGDIAEQTLAGATSTGTHGTGGTVASLSAQVTQLRLLTADGTIMEISQQHNRDLLDHARLGLGALGIITELTFAVEPLFYLHAVETPMLLHEVTSRYDDLVASNDHFEFFWFPHTQRCLTKQHQRVTRPGVPLPTWRRWLDDELLSNTVFGWTNAVGNQVPRLIPAINNLAAQLLTPRQYTDVAHRVFVTPRRVRFREMEYAVPAAVGMEALQQVRQWLESTDLAVSFPVEVRFVPSDELSLSAAYRQDSVYLAFHVNQATDHAEYFAGVEAILRQFGGRPHWGKLHTCTAAELKELYPRFDEFTSLRARLDPDGIFLNPYLGVMLGIDPQT